MPGMRIEVDFGNAQKLDSVVIQTSPDWRDPEMRLEAMDQAGHWSSLAGKPVETEQPIRVSLRRAASEELKSRGVRYLVSATGDLGAEDFRRNAFAWGIRLIAERNSFRLYYIE